MTDTALRPKSLRSSWVQINSADDVHSEDAKHNPADFRVSMPNSLGSTNIWRVVPHTIAVPNAFPTMYAPLNNRMRLWERKIIRTQIDGAHWNVSLDPNWTSTDIVFVQGRYTNIDVFKDLTDNMLPSGRWESFIDLLTCFVIRGVPYPQPSHLDTQYWGTFASELEPNGPVFFPCIAYLEELEGSHLFDVFGFGRRRFDHSTGSSLLDSVSRIFDPENPRTVDCIAGSNLEEAKDRIIPLFDIQEQNYLNWTINPIFLDNRVFNPVNLDIPMWINVVVEELGDTSTIDTGTGNMSSVVATVCLDRLDSVWDGFHYAVRVAHDCDVEAIQFRTPRIIRNFTVKLRDERGRQLTLPRNFPVILRLQLLHEE
jgi:hypothetical protein